MNCEQNDFNIYGDDAEALFSVGRRFLNGNGLEKDLVKAHDLLSKAAAL